MCRHNIWGHILIAQLKFNNRTGLVTVVLFTLLHSVFAIYLLCVGFSQMLMILYGRWERCELCGGPMSKLQWTMRIESFLQNRSLRCLVGVCSSSGPLKILHFHKILFVSFSAAFQILNLYSSARCPSRKDISNEKVPKSFHHLLGLVLLSWVVLTATPLLNN